MKKDKKDWIWIESRRLRNLLTASYFLFLASVFNVPSFAGGYFEKTFGGINDDEGLFVQETSEKGLIIIGETQSFGSGGSDVFLIKTDSLGDTLWTKTYGGSTNDRGRSLQETSDGGYILIGETRSFGAGHYDVYLIKTNSLGDTLWTKTFGGSGFDEGNSVRETSDGGYILIGETRSFGAGQYDVYLIKTDSLGDTLWTKTFGGAADEEGLSLHETLDGGYIIVGLTVSFGAGMNDVYLIRTDSLGDTLWTKTIGGTSDESGQSVQETSDRGYIITGYTRSFGAGMDDVYLIKTDSLGDTLWTRTIGGAADDFGQSVQETPDGSYIITGYTQSYGAGGYDVYLVKYGSTVIHDGGVVTLDAPGDTVFTDSTYAVMATVRNFGDIRETFDVISSIGGYADTVQVTGLLPDSSIQVPFNLWQVPPTDSTTYIMTVCTQVSQDSATSNDCVSKFIFALTPVGVEEESNYQMPITNFNLFQNHPNPFHSRTMIHYQIPSMNHDTRYTNHVRLEVYDITGRLVMTLVDGNQKPGFYQLPITSHQLPTSGIYFYRLTIGVNLNTPLLYVSSKKMTILK
jgi:hypothetical protein